MHRDADQNGYFVLTLAAPKAAAVLAQDVTLVVDGSKTEAGAQSRLAAVLMLEKVRAADRINVVLARSRTFTSRLYDAPKWATAETREEAIAFIETAGTSVDPPDVKSAMVAALEAQEQTGQNRTVVPLSGAAPAGRDLGLVGGSNAKATRVFTVGSVPASTAPRSAPWRARTAVDSSSSRTAPR